MHPGRRIGRLGRAALVLPVLLGVLAMHVLMLCADVGAGHHGESPGAATAMHHSSHSDDVADAMTAAAHGTSARLDRAGPVIAAVADHAPVEALDSDHRAMAMCLAVLAALGLVLRRRPSAAAGLLATALALRPGRLPAATALPPPGPPLLLTLCVLRT